MKPEDSPLDLGRAHRRFAADCFNCAWALIETENRTPAEDDTMLLASSASLWHWMHCPDRIDRNLSIGHWQLSRVHALLNDGDRAMRHAQESLRYASGSPPFYVGYAHEAIVRAALEQSDLPLAQEHLKLAQSHLEGVLDPAERNALKADLQSLISDAAGMR